MWINVFVETYELGEAMHLVRRSVVLVGHRELFICNMSISDS